MISFQSLLLNHFHISKTKEVIVQNLFWAILGKTVSLVGSLLVGIIVARYLGPTQYGLMSYVISYVFLFQVFALFGLDAIEMREESRNERPKEVIIGTAFGLKVLFGFIFMAISIMTSWFMEADHHTTLLVAIYSLSIVFNAFVVIRNHFTAIVQNKAAIKAEISRTLLSLAIKTVLLLMNAPLTWFVCAYMLDFVVLAIGYSIAYRSRIGKLGDWQFDVHCAKYLLKESFPLLLTNAAVIIYQRIDQVMIGQMIDSEAVGYFSVASRFVEVLVFVPMILSQTITPLLVRAREKSQEEYIEKARQFMNFSFWLSMLISIVFSLSATLLIRYTFGEVYMPAAIVLQVMAFKTASVALSNTAGAMLVTEGLQRWAIIRDGLGCVACIGLNLWLLPKYGIIAAAFIAIASNVIAGYLADALIPAYRHLFVCQTKTLLVGWKDLIHIRRLFK